MAVDETGRGVFEDKATKNLFACEYMVNYLRDLKTVGIISEDPVTGITEVARASWCCCRFNTSNKPYFNSNLQEFTCIKDKKPYHLCVPPKCTKVLC